MRIASQAFREAISRRIGVGRNIGVGAVLFPAEYSTVNYGIRVLGRTGSPT
ncbi:hypothetical protein [Streptomyces sp. NPDC088847]|uniref:hypothetical protein n=1 Tax=Streptomyces sp. NPDC088847 TaxID=3365909 RepID=UPI0037FE6AA9